MQKEKVRAILTAQRQKKSQEDKESGFTLHIYKAYTDI